MLVACPVPFRSSKSKTFVDIYLKWNVEPWNLEDFSNYNIARTDIQLIKCLANTRLLAGAVSRRSIKLLRYSGRQMLDHLLVYLFPPSSFSIVSVQHALLQRQPQLQGPPQTQPRPDIISGGRAQECGHTTTLLQIMMALPSAKMEGYHITVVMRPGNGVSVCICPPLKSEQSSKRRDIKVGKTRVFRCEVKFCEENKQGLIPGSGSSAWGGRSGGPVSVWASKSDNFIG
jgi:hypothetical protein